MEPLCIDANVFIASTKGNEAYSSDCRRVIGALAKNDFYLIEPRRRLKQAFSFQRALYSTEFFHGKRIKCPAV